MLVKYLNFKTWTIRRGLYLGVGLFLVVLAIVEQEGLGALIGAYFMIMAIFNVGCASGCCSNHNCDIKFSKEKQTHK